MHEKKEYNNAHILVVDDDKIIADILRDFLSGSGKSVDVCHDGLDAIKKMEEFHYDLILVDLMMPKVGGIDVLKYAKTTNPDVIVIIITGYASVESAIDAIREGAYDYIRKPCKLEEIKIVVDNAIEKIALLRENRALLKKLEETYHELLALKEISQENKKITKINFFSSNMPSLHYLFENKSSFQSQIEKLETLSGLKEKGMLTENEFKEFKKNLLKSVEPRD